jgi:hypothetical protein
MKISKSRLTRIIKEELHRVISEASPARANPYMGKIKPGKMGTEVEVQGRSFDEYLGHRGDPYRYIIHRGDWWAQRVGKGDAYMSMKETSWKDWNRLPGNNQSYQDSVDKLDAMYPGKRIPVIAQTPPVPTPTPVPVPETGGSQEDAVLVLAKLGTEGPGPGGVNYQMLKTMYDQGQYDEVLSQGRRLGTGSADDAWLHFVTSTQEGGGLSFPRSGRHILTAQYNTEWDQAGPLKAINWAIKNGAQFDMRGFDDRSIKSALGQAVMARAS